jgi:predicted Zn-dependent peptidase
MKHTVSEVHLKNGAKGLLVDVPGATVTSYELNFRAGEYLINDPKKWETAHIVEHTILGANEAYPDSQAFQAEFGRNGAYTNAYTSQYYIGYVGETADFEWERVLNLLSTALSKPLFLQEEFESESGNIRDELTSLCNNHFRALNEKLTKNFGFNIATDHERVKLMKNVTREDLVKHYKRTHFTNNMRFIIAGNLRGRRVAIKKLLSNIDLPAGPVGFKLPVEVAAKPPKPTFIPNETVKNIYFILSTYHNDTLSQKDDDALALARIMLTDTLYSKIFGQAREKGLVYNVSSSHSQYSKYSEWWLSSQVLPENAPALCDIILSEIKKVQNGKIDDAILEGTQQYALGAFQRSMQTVDTVAGAYNRYFFDEYIEDVRSIPGRIKATTKRDIARAMRRMFTENVGSVGVLGGTDSSIARKLNEQLQTLWD